MKRISAPPSSIWATGDGTPVTKQGGSFLVFGLSDVLLTVEAPKKVDGLSMSDLGRRLLPFN